MLPKKSGRNPRSLRKIFVLTTGVLALATIALRAQAPGEAPGSNDAIARLGRRMAAGEVVLDYREGAGYLPSLLERLGINIDSQVLVFSKTSFQHAFINPKNPRALYFNDNVAVGTVPGGAVYEILALEPSHGLAFYSLDVHKTDRPVFQRRGVECLFCHGPGNKGASAMVVASVYPDAQGVPAYTSAFIDTIDHQTPFDRRWGGWYVSGTHGSQVHMGNAVSRDPEHPLDLEQANTQNLTSLGEKFDVTKYLTGTSDIVALLTLDHQVGMVNRLGAVSVQYRRAQESGGLNAADAARLDEGVRDLVDYMLFVAEAPLGEPVQGVSAFTQTFPQRGPRDRRGRSLREFDLRTRLFRYPLSYMIYSELFDAMPDALRDRVYWRLHDVLTGKVTGPKSVSRSAVEREALLQIIRDTKSNLPEDW
jgi:hypothetical protein